MTKTIARTLTAGILLLSATACSSESGTSNPATSSNAPTSPSSTGPKVPQVTTPLDVTKYEQDPCSALTQTQATQVFNAARSRKNDSNVAPACDWFDSDNNGVSLGFLPGQGGLTTVYGNSSGSSAGYFEAAPDVFGYPAAFSDVSDDRKNGACQIFVGVTSDEAFSVSSLLRPSSSSYSDPCSLVTKVAEAAVATIKAGA
ncbi:DUF3558 domain-containing protein [Amycolatopsis jiangsuensis]|uniref:DUF3558 domain-containing protein n=1 Tax=Amycolatopsis jiangsuensis TaxID=1181879 RepID=A0A840IX16_9PSEU|nr:DUF3558 domain-containing protein [Amycolatopsis jiangsuensis]MBB4686400.1 hypothetical protein [Amycolatopsis jiangsuensis]